MNNENTAKQDSGLPSRPLNCSTAREKGRPFSHLEPRALQMLFEIAETKGDDLTCFAILDEFNLRKLVVTE